MYYWNLYHSGLKSFSEKKMKELLYRWASTSKRLQRYARRTESDINVTCIAKRRVCIYRVAVEKVRFGESRSLARDEYKKREACIHVEYVALATSRKHVTVCVFIFNFFFFSTTPRVCNT